jgi:hypothetical protein
MLHHQISNEIPVGSQAAAENHDEERRSNKYFIYYQ